MPALCLSFLGVAHLTLDGVPIQLERRNSLALLAYLVLTDRPHSRDELATLMAGDIGDDTARKRLRNSLADLVERGFGDYLLTSRQTVAFNSAMPHTLDIRRLDALSADGSLADPESLAWASERCDWELLSGLAPRDAPAFEMWLTGERERRGQQVRELAQRHLERLLLTAEYDAGVSLAHRLLAVEPWNEQVHRCLMRLFGRSGRIAAALAQYDRCREALADELGLEPQPETTALYERLRSGTAAPRSNLPVTMDAHEIIGRDQQLLAVTRNLIDPTCRLLTIVGLGGSGKTSLALAAASRFVAPAQPGDEHPFADGIFLVTLGELVDRDALPETDEAAQRRLATAIGFALGLVFYGHIDRVSQVVAYLQPKRLLLVLDSMEHVHSGSPALQAILRGAPGVTVLVTSRQVLGIADEWIQHLGGLAAPVTVDQIEDAPASRLFLREARRGNVLIRDADLPAIMQICQLTGGWPLALKIAAGWLGPLTCNEIVRELDHGGALLNEPYPREDARQTSIRSIVASSFDILPEREQLALSRLSVFSGPFDRTAAEAIGVTSPSLVALSQRSLLDRSDEGTFRLHPLVSQFASEQLSIKSAEEEAVRNDHALYFAALVKDSTALLFANPDTHALIVGEQANVRSAWNWAVGQQDVDLLAKLWMGLAAWSQQAGLHREWTALLTAAIASFRDDLNDTARRTMFAQLLAAKAESLLWQGDLDGAFPLLQEAHYHADQVDSLQLKALISFCEGRLLRFRGGESEAAIERLQQARVLALATHQQRIEAESLLQLSFATTDSENYREAETFLNRAEDAFRALGDRLSLARSSNQRGRLAVYLGDYTRAQIALEESAHVAQKFGDRFLEGYSWMVLGFVSDVAFGRHAEADEHFARSVAIASSMGDPYFDGNIHRAIGRNAIHAGDFARATQTLNHAVARAREVGNTRALGDSLSALAQLANALGDYASAEDRAQQALYLSIEQGRRNTSASALMSLGQARERSGRVSLAVASYTEAFNLADALGIPHLRCDATVGLASASLAAGDPLLASRYVEEVLPCLKDHALAGCEEPGWVIETCMRVLTEVNDHRAVDVLQMGASLLDRRLSTLPVAQRDRYLSAFSDRKIVLGRWLEYVSSNTPGERQHLSVLTPRSDVAPNVDRTRQSTASYMPYDLPVQPRSGQEHTRYRLGRVRRAKRPRSRGGTSQS